MNEYRSMDDLPDILPWKRTAFRAVLLTMLGLAGCASPGGLYSMSDAWCAKHPKASPARCVLRLVK